MRRNGYLWTSGVNLDTTFRFADYDFLSECKISAIGDVFRWLLHFIFWMSAIFLLPVCLTYWPRKYITRVDPHVDEFPTKFEVDMCIHCRVIAFLSADTSRDLVTLTFALLALCSCHAWRVTWPTLPPSTKTLRLSVLELPVITFPISYYWKCIRGHCACAESRDPWVGGEKRLRFWNPRPRFAYSLYNFGGSTINIIKVICENNARPVLKDVWDSPHARNHVICLRWPKCLIADQPSHQVRRPHAYPFLIYEL